MCEQCLAKAENLGEPIPGFFLVYATQDGSYMKAGQYGLVEMNDPFLIFDMKPTPDPSEGMSDEEINQLRQSEMSTMMDWLEMARSFEDIFEVGPKLGYRFVNACKKSGYKDEDGSVTIWFFHKAGEMLEKSELSQEAPSWTSGGMLPER